MLTYNYNLTIFMCKTIGMFLLQNTTRGGGSRTAATSKMEHFVVIVKGWKPFTVIRKCSVLDVVAVLDPPMTTV